MIDSTPESSAANTPVPSRPSTPSVAAGSGASTPATGAGSTRGGGGLSRFRPKNVRRDADERKKLEEQRSRDLAAKIKVEERELAKEERRARRGGRGGRGDAMSQRGTMRRNGAASGPFSAMPQGMFLFLSVVKCQLVSVALGDTGPFPPLLLCFLTFTH